MFIKIFNENAWLKNTARSDYKSAENMKREISGVCMCCIIVRVRGRSVRLWCFWYIPLS